MVAAFFGSSFQPSFLISFDNLHVSKTVLAGQTHFQSKCLHPSTYPDLCTCWSIRAASWRAGMIHVCQQFPGCGAQPSFSMVNFCGRSLDISLDFSADLIHASESVGFPNHQGT